MHACLDHLVGVILVYNCLDLAVEISLFASYFMPSPIDYLNDTFRVIMHLNPLICFSCVLSRLSTFKMVIDVFA